MSFANNTVMDGNLQRKTLPGDIVIYGEVIATNSTVGASTLSALQIGSGILSRSGSTANYTDTTDTAANIITQMIGNYNYNTSSTAGLSSGQAVQPGSTFRFKYINTVAFTATIAAGTGVTLGTNATTVNASSVKEFLITITNGTPAQTFNANTTSGSALISNLNQFQTSQLSAGMLVTGTGIAANTTVLSVQSGVGVTLSANATATNTGTALTFSPTVLFNSLGQGLL